VLTGMKGERIGGVELGCAELPEATVSPLVQW
jgi:hypothetical protein